MTITRQDIRPGSWHALNLAGHATHLLPVAFGLVIGWVVWTRATELTPEGKTVVIVTVFAVIGWVATRLPDSLVALIAALTLVVTGAQPQDALTDTLGQKIVWLLLAAFVIAAVIKHAGLAERLVTPLTRSTPQVLPFFLATGAAISLTAFLLPSTSGRAALLLPVYLGLLTSLPDPRLAKPLALLFPTAILLSAGGSLIGAGAHVVAVEAISATSGPRLDYLDWLLVGGPLAIASVTVATLLIFALFVPRDLKQARLLAPTETTAFAPVQVRILIVLSGLVAMWIAKPLHGLDEAIVALGGAILLLLPPFCAQKPKDVFRAVDVELVLYMAATLMLSVAVIDTGVDQWLATGALTLLPSELATHSLSMVLFLALVAVGAHLAITSRSARAAILIPALALPMAGLGHDVTLAILITVMGTGFCQTMMASAKPVAIFGMQDQAGFTQKDLLRLALPLAPVKVALLVAFALWVWPHQLEQLTAAEGHPEEVPSAQTSTGHTALGGSDRPDSQANGGGAGPTLKPDPEPDTIIAVSLRPHPRPIRPVSAAKARTPDTQIGQVVIAPPHLPTVAQLRRDLQLAGQDLRKAGRQIERQLSRLIR